MVHIDDLNEKGVLVTGASSGIGAAVSRAFAAQGARVAVHWHANERGSGTGIYGSAKAFVHNLSRHLALEFAADHIRVNTVAPGVVATPFHTTTPPERMEAMRKSVYLGRLGTSEDCVGAILFLASPQLSCYITGQLIHLNGGQVMP